MTITRINPTYPIAYGNGWTALHAENNGTMHRLQVNSNGDIRLYKSINGGTSWTYIDYNNSIPRTYRFDTGSVACWIKLGTLQTGNADSTFFQVFTGSGNNARVDQNTRLDIFVKDGWQSTPAAASSYAAKVYMYNNATNVDIKLIANGTNGDKVDVWFYAPWGYASGCYIMYGEYTTWTHSGSTQTSAPGGTAQPVSIVRY